MLPQDAAKIQGAVMNILNAMFENNSEYRQSLTQSEDYILVAAIELLNAQQNIVQKIVAEMKEGVYISPSEVNSQKGQKEKSSYLWMGAIAGVTIGTASGVFVVIENGGRAVEWLGE